MSTKKKIVYLMNKIEPADLETIYEVVKKFAFSEFAHDEIPNEDTIEALAEVEEMERHPEKYKGYTDIDEMMKELLA